MVAMLKKPSMRIARSSEGTEADDRRVFPRTESTAQVQGTRVDHTIPAHRQPQVNLALRDISAGGLSAITSTPLLAGDRLVVSFPMQPGRPGWDAAGRVVRCEPSVIGWRIAMEFEQRRAA